MTDPPETPDPGAATSAALRTEGKKLFSMTLRTAYRIAFERLEEHSSARDVARFVAGNVVRKWKKDPAEFARQGSPEGLIYRSVVNRLRDLRKAERARAKAERRYGDLQEEHEGLTAHDLMEMKERQRLYQLVVESMPAGMRQVYRIQRETDMTYEEMAAHLGIGPGTVKTQLRRANERMKVARDAYERDGLMPDADDEEGRPARDGGIDNE
jgi:RNA polymerase sigma-70 factor (ECF subfamily)